MRLPCVVGAAALVFAFGVRVPARAGTSRSTFTVSVEVRDACSIGFDTSAGEPRATFRATCSSGAGGAVTISGSGVIRAVDLSSGQRPLRVTITPVPRQTTAESRTGAERGGANVFIATLTF